MGRWIDFDNGYRTMDPTFMESVWWVFKQLHEKGLIYRGFKVCTTSASKVGRFHACVEPGEGTGIMVAFNGEVKGEFQVHVDQKHLTHFA